MKKITKRRGQKKLDKLLDLPEEISTDEPKITVLSFEKLVVENYKGILEYYENLIKVSTYIGIVNIVGKNLTLNEMTVDDVMIMGSIDAIDFEAVEG